MELSALIDLAAQKHGSMTKLARALGLPDTHLHNMKAGTRACPLHVKAQLYQAAGLDWKTPVLKEVAAKMGKAARASALGALAMLSFGSGSDPRLAGAHGRMTDRDNVYRGRRKRA